MEENFNIMTYIVQKWPSFVEIQENCVRYVMWIGLYLNIFAKPHPGSIFERMQVYKNVKLYNVIKKITILSLLPENDCID
jgi:hypothetical protein